jgi:hypothetical protein
LANRSYDVLIDAVFDRAETGPRQLPEVITAICAADNQSALGMAIDKSDEVIPFILAWMDKAPDQDPLTSLGRTLRRRQAAVMRVASDNGPFKVQTMERLLLETLGDDREVLQLASAKAWITVADDQLGKETQPDVAAHLFILSRSSHGDAQRELLAKSFVALHRVLADDRVSPEDWELVTRRLPPGRRWSEWDKCDRLRRGFVASFLDSTGDPQWFAHAAQEIDEVPEMFQLLRKHPRGASLARWIANS